MNDSRTRTYAWHDPLIGAKAALTMSGLDYLRAIAAGDIPIAPIAETMAITASEVSEGRAVFSATPAEFHYNPIGVVHGGFAATILDSAMGCAVHSMLPQGIGYGTLEVQVNFLRPITKDTGPMQAVGEVIHAGKRVGSAQGRLVDADGKLYAHATTTCIISEVDPAMLADVTPSSEPRTRTYSWGDPLATARAGRDTTSLLFLEYIAQGKLPPPPIANTLGYTLAQAGDGRGVFASEPKEFHYNPIGTVHGGFAATLLDSALAVSMQNQMPDGSGAGTLELNLYFVRPITMGVGLLHAEAEMIHLGKRIGTSQGRLVDENGKLYAHGSTACMIIPM